MKFLLSFLTLLFFMSFTGYAQDLSHHQWKDRLVLILTADPNSEGVQEQLARFREKEEGMNERKLVLYQMTPAQFRIGLSEKGEWRSGKALFEKYKRSSSSFELFLIGLDGGVKLFRKSPVSCEELFGRIDQMPMRKAEMERH
jgi:hypothetical protein